MTRCGAVAPSARQIRSPWARIQEWVSSRIERENELRPATVIGCSCDQNEGRGIFVKGGGGCRLCGSVQHIASDCPDNDNKKKKRRGDDDDVEVDADGAAVVDDLLEAEAGNEATSRKKKAGTGKKARKRDQDEGRSGGNDGSGNDGDDGDAAATVKPEPPKTKKRKKKVVNF